MEVVHPRCAGLDIHKRSVVACRVTPGADGRPAKELRTFGTLTRELLALADWLDEGGVTIVAMESTGVYWKPIVNLLEERFELLVANAAHLKAVPGRKTDVKDAEWIADLLRHGLLRASYIPARPERELRELTRYRTSLVHERAGELDRLAKVLEGANVKLASVVSTLDGSAARAMLEALVEDRPDPARAVPARRTGFPLKASPEALADALEGRMGEHQRFLLATQLRHVDELDALIASVSREIEARFRPFDKAIESLMTVPGVSRRTAEIVLAEIGTDMARFASARRLASWAGLCPGNHESAGRSKGGATRKGSPWLRAALARSAMAAGRTRTHLGAQYRRLAARRGLMRAKIAVAHSLLVIIRAILISGQPFRDLGEAWFDERAHDQVRRRLTRRLERLGYEVSITPIAA